MIYTGENGGHDMHSHPHDTRANPPGPLDGGNMSGGRSTPNPLNAGDSMHVSG